VCQHLEGGVVIVQGGVGAEAVAMSDSGVLDL